MFLPQFFLEIPRNPLTAVGIPLALGIFSGSGTARVVRSPWYQNLKAPPGRPPRQAFPIVWPILYLSMGYASHLAAKALETSVLPDTRSALTTGLTLYYAQLALNCAWSPLFFNAGQISIALVDSVFLAGTAYAMTAVLHGPTNHQTTWFLAPYCAWLTFATYLNAGIWWKNIARPSVKKD